MRVTRRAALAGVAATALPCAATAQPYPSRPVRVIVPFAPGAATDILARLMAQQFSEALGQPFPAENRTGANGAIAAELVAKGPKDGSMILKGTFSTHTSNPHIYPRFPYDPVADFAPVVLVATVPVLVVLHPSLRITSLAGLIEAARGRPGQITVASGGIGSSQHLAPVLFGREANVSLDIIHYTRGFATVIPDLLENRVNGTFGDPLSLLPAVREGRLVPLAVTSPQRSPVLPEVPTMAEAGLPNAGLVPWYGMFVAAGTDPAIVARLGDTAAAAIRRPEVAARIRELGGMPDGRTGAAFGQFQQAEFARWGEVIRAAGIRVE
jgi:tripartite-type tricarboxylate transporter receptor subunit TctC